MKAREKVKHLIRKAFTPDQLYGPEAGPPIDGKPVAIPVGFRRPETLQEQVARLVRFDLSRRAQEQGGESFEEFHDFDIPDDPVEPSTPFEEFFDPVIGRAITPDELQRFDKEYRERYLKVQADKISEEDRAAVFAEHLAQIRREKAKGKGGSAGSHSPEPGDPPAPKS